MCVLSDSHTSGDVAPKRDSTHHSLRSIEVVLVSSLSAARPVLLVLLAVLLLLLFLHRCGSTLGALCYRRSKAVIKSTRAHVPVRFSPEGAGPSTLQGAEIKMSPGGFLRMNVQSLCLVSSMPRYPQALQELPMVCFLGLTCWKKETDICASVLKPSVIRLCFLNLVEYLPDQFQGCHTRDTAQIF